MWSVQSYVNRRLAMLPNVKTRDDYASLPTSERLKVRDALYKRLDLLDAFVAENPDNLRPEELAIVASWIISGRNRLDASSRLSRRILPQQPNLSLKSVFATGGPKWIRLAG